MTTFLVSVTISLRVKFPVWPFAFVVKLFLALPTMSIVCLFLLILMVLTELSINVVYRLYVEIGDCSCCIALVVPSELT